MNAPTESVTLRRVLGLPMLVFYGVGVTIGAGIFALIGEIVRVAGDKAPLAFLVAGFIAAATGLSYAKLSSVYPRAGGEAVYVNIAAGYQGIEGRRHQFVCGIYKVVFQLQLFG